ncbi:uncharacterized protein CANTADRAFT_92886 [Suhomyces tanzawaensis NRRL Y-17324]|uniref:Uncharacterized protein n=1 Tax=Suhomyces tanzawaensis NRRL Y-17324 TaxID=984487 RepID=A0A1E4SQ50_9ASCO|nr:uncharacterized protein CANTADRAFT_92886 [Suhomyces tanzawaensis NRRL Y-17324]ODV81641.1 hypothetical protein CANTADRAFT_92886 [Suhomyces tanzawaensis NRRL Y-17324]
MSTRQQPPTTGLQGIAGFLKNLIVKESQALSESINRNLDSLDEDTHTADLEPNLKNDLAKILDTNHKLFIMLTYSPLLINPESYLALYEQLENPLDNALKTLLIRRLLFHRQYEKCWKICLETYTSLTDLEDFLDVAFQAFEENDNLAFGLLELLIASQTEEINPGFRNHIVDICSLKYKISKEWIQLNLSLWLELDNLQNIEDFSAFKASYNINDRNSQMLYLKKLFETIQHNSPNQQEIAHLIQEHGDITKYPGWLSVVGPQFAHSSNFPFLKEWKTPMIATALSKYVETLADSTNLNANDVVYLIRSNPNFDAYQTYQAYHKNGKKSNKYIINYLLSKLNEAGTIEQINSVLAEHFQVLDDSPLIKSISRVYVESHQNFASCFKQLNSLPQDRKEKLIPEFLDLAFSSPIPIHDVHKLIKQLHFSYNPKGIRNVLRKVANGEYPRDEQLHFYRLLASDDQLLSKQMVLELFRSMLLRSNIYEHTLIGDMFEKLLELTLRKEVILARSEGSNQKFHHDIQKLLFFATSKEKADFHNALRAFGQTISLMEAKNIATVIYSINERFQSGQFTFVTSVYGKDYIMNNLMLEVMRFVERSGDSTSGILKMRDIISTLNDSNSQKEALATAQSSLFKLMIKDDPTKAVKLLQLYQTTKAKLSGKITFMILGILTSPKLDINQKIQFFKSFLDKLKEYGYNYRIRQVIIHQVMKVLRDDKLKLSHDSKIWLFGILQEVKGTKRVVEKLIKQKRKAQNSRASN